MSKRAWPVEKEPYIIERFQAGASVKQITRELGGGQRSVSNVIKRHGLTPVIGSEKVGSPRRQFAPETLAVIKEMWEDGQPIVRVIRRTGHAEPVVRRALAELGFEYEPRIFKGARHHLWRGGSRTSHGYWKVMVYDDDPMVTMRDSKGYVLEHRLVMARALGRPLRKGETVHHVNGDKTDNRLENLQLRDGPHGRGVALRCRSCGSHDVTFAELE